MGNKGLIRGEPTTTKKGQDKAQPFTHNQDLLIAKTGLAIGFAPHFDLLDYALGAIILPVFRVEDKVRSSGVLSQPSEFSYQLVSFPLSFSIG